VTRWLKKPVVMKVSGSHVITTMSGSWLGRLELEWLKQWAKRVMILNDGMRDEAYQAGFSPEQLLWMPNPVDVNEFCPLEETDRQRARAERNLGGPAVIYIGRLAPEKQLPSLLRAFSLSVVRHPKATLTLLGDGPCRAELESLVSELDIASNVTFTGRVPMDQVLRWLQASDIFALVSSGEGFPCSLAEAMSVGLPSVVSDIPGTRQLIQQNVQGLLATMGDEQAISEALNVLIADGNLRTKMGNLARRCIIDNYSTEKLMERYETLFDETVR
jgi:glycosyltransferase involved in cell wall biosynthesis